MDFSDPDHNWQFMDSQVYYIIVAMLFASFTLSIVFFMSWLTQGRKAHALSWAIGFLAASSQWFFNLNVNWFTQPELHWLIVNAFAMVLITLGIRGHCQRTDCESLPKNLWPYAGAVYAVVVWTTVVDPHIGVSKAMVPAAAAMTLFISALMIIRHRERSRAAERATAITLVLFGITQAIAAWMAVMQGPNGNVDYQNLYAHYNFLALPSGYIAMGMFTVFMLASDLSEQMKEIAVVDQLTGVFNRRGLIERGGVAFASSRRTDVPVSIVMTDIDRFKFINDEFGHSVGDEALVHFASLMKEGRRVDDILARVGGEEFALVLQGSDLESAMKIADGLCRRIEKSPMQVDGVELRMTASFGVATVSARDSDLSETIVRADRALYRSKRAGRNQVDLESSQKMLAADGSLKPIIT